MSGRAAGGGPEGGVGVVPQASVCGPEGVILAPSVTSIVGSALFLLVGIIGMTGG